MRGLNAAGVLTLLLLDASVAAFFSPSPSLPLVSKAFQGVCGRVSTNGQLGRPDVPVLKTNRGLNALHMAVDGAEAQSNRNVKLWNSGI